MKIACKADWEHMWSVSSAYSVCQQQIYLSANHTAQKLSMQVHAPSRNLAS